MTYREVLSKAYNTWPYFLSVLILILVSFTIIRPQHIALDFAWIASDNSLLQRNYIVSNEKIESTGFKTEFSLDRGIGELLKGYTMIKNSLYGNV